MAWYNDDWLYRVKVTVPSTKVASTLSNFPIFVDLGSLPPSFHENVKLNGADIRITSSDGSTELAREVVFYNKDTSAGELHFKVGSLSSSSDNVFFIYYGNSSATDNAVGSTFGAYNVWASFDAVYHLSEPANTTANGYKNSKANTNHGTGISMGLPSVPGKVGNTQVFDGIDDKIYTTSNYGVGTGNTTISGWVRIDAATGKGAFFGIGNHLTGFKIGWGATNFDTIGNKLIIIFDAVRWGITSYVLTPGYYFITLIINGGVPSAYVNGVLIGSYGGPSMITPANESNIGSSGGAIRYFQGGVSEFRVYKGVRPANWLLTEYSNQNAVNNFYNIGVQEWRYPDLEQLQLPKNLAIGELDIPEYTVELWSSSDIYMADVSILLVDGFRLSMPLNDVEDLEFALDLVKFEEKCERLGVAPRNILEPYRTDVKIRRNGAYLVGTQVVEATVNLNNNSANTIQVKCTGYLNLFKDRYITPGSGDAYEANYKNRTYAEIAQRLILDTQQQANGDFGVRLGDDDASLSQSMTRSRAGDYDNQGVKDGIINLTKLQNDNFDFKFTWDKKFKCYDRLGKDKPEIELVYSYNAKSMTILRDASTLANKITGIGSGIGDERLMYTESDAISTNAYGVREKIELFNSTGNQGTLNTSVSGLIPIYKDIHEVPSVSVTNGAIQPGRDITGDAVIIRVEGSTFVGNINSLHRIIDMKLNVDINNEESISLKLIKWG